MISAKALSNLLYTLYSAPPRPAAWNDFLRDLCTQANLSGAAILEHDVEREHHNVQYSYGSDSEWAGLYKEYYGEIDEYKERFLRTREGVFALGDELCPPNKMKVTEFYNDFLQKYDIRLYGAIATVNRPNHLEHISLYTSWKNRRRGAHARELGALLFPHLKNALDLRRKFVDIAALNSSLMAGLDLLPQGIILIGQSGIIAVNRAAEQILRLHDGLLILGNHLAADIPSESHRLQNVIAKVTQTAWLDLSSLSEVTLFSVSLPPNVVWPCS